MARSTTTCENFLQTPLLVIGFVVLVISLAGFIGACFHVAWALWLYLVVMLFLMAALFGLTVFGFVVTSQGRGVEVPGRVYMEYRLEDYSPWLKNRIKDPRYWSTIRSCVLGSNTCAKLASWTSLDYMQRDMSPIQVQSLIHSLWVSSIIAFCLLFLQNDPHTLFYGVLFNTCNLQFLTVINYKVFFLYSVIYDC